MLLGFLEALRAGGVPASIKEHLLLLEALDREAIARSADEFYYLARAIYVKDETLIDRFDRVFAAHFRGVFDPAAPGVSEVPEDWLRAVAEKFLSEEDKAKIAALGSWDEIMAALQERLAEQEGRHEGGSKWIGTGGTSPFGNNGYNPAGVRIGGQGKNGRAIKVWEQRAFRNLDASRELGTRNIKIALRRLRKFAREGAADELDLDGTIDGTARQGWLDIRMRPERHNAVKLLLFLDVGGSMDPFIKLVEELFSAATTEFRHLEFFYFHNCLYEGVWKDNRRRRSEQTSTAEILRKYGPDWKVVFVGDASMSPYEVTQPGGSVEHYNDEAGAVWLQRMRRAYRALVWLNPSPQAHWGYSASTAVIRDLVGGAMFELTLDGIDAAMRELVRKRCSVPA